MFKKLTINFAPDKFYLVHQILTQLAFNTQKGIV